MEGRTKGRCGGVEREEVKGCMGESVWKGVYNSVCMEGECMEEDYMEWKGC